LKREVEYLVGTPKPIPKARRWGRKQKFRKAVKAEAKRLVERYLRQHVPGWQTALPLWGETGGRPTGGPEHASGGRNEEGGS